MISLSDGQRNCSVECNSKVQGASALKCMIVSDCFGLFLWFLVSKNQVIFGYLAATFATGSSSRLCLLVFR